MLAGEIKGIHNTIAKIRHDNQPAFQARPTLDLPVRGAQKEQDPSLEDNEVVGFDEEARVVIKRLVGGSEDLDVVPVVGLAGLGKSTLARKIYNDSEVTFEFYNNIWIYVSESYIVKDVYLDILKKFTKKIEEHQNKNVDEIAKVIGEFVAQGGRCLIVLDDVWVTEVVDIVKKVFPEKNKGHRIMVTTRDSYVAKYANAEPHYLKFLTAAESFQLLEKRVFGSVKCPDNLAEHGQNIAGKCSGVPLAVVVIAGALRGRTNTNEWLRVEKNVGEHLISREDPNSCLKFVEMSYDRLPQEMKSCFLYCAAFPRGFDIPTWKLVRLWIAEGLIKFNASYTLEEVAEYILNDLVNRNLVMVMDKKSDGQTKTCRVHDMLHLFCMDLATSESLFQQICRTPDQGLPAIQDPDISRRLCIQSSVLSNFISLKPVAEHVRSLLCFSLEKEKLIELSALNIRALHKAFPLLRVLDIESLKFLFSKDFNQLFHLRYIAITGDFKAIPAPFGKFWNLQTLILNTSTSEPTLDIKADIWNMSRLRHLHTNIPAKLPSPPNPAGTGSCLQTLSLVAPESCKKDVFKKACNLKKLSILGQMATFLESSKDGISNLEELKGLEHLKLLNGVLYPVKVLHLPPAFFRFVRTLKKLTLSNTRFEWNEANRLGQLEFLEVLKLKENAFTGESWKAETGGFSVLQVLWIERADFKSWEAQNLPFPRLRHLVLIACDKLEAVPIELADVPSLQEMRLDTTIKAVKSAKEIQCKKDKVQGPNCIKFKLAIFPPETDSKATQ